MRAKQTAQSRSRLALGPGDCSDGYCSVACEGAIACAEQDQNRCIVPIRHGEIDMSIHIEISRGCRVRTAARRDRLARREFAVAVALGEKNDGLCTPVVLSDDLIGVAVVVKVADGEGVVFGQVLEFQGRVAKAAVSLAEVDQYLSFRRSIRDPVEIAIVV